MLSIVINLLVLLLMTSFYTAVLNHRFEKMERKDYVEQRHQVERLLQEK